MLLGGCLFKCTQVYNSPYNRPGCASRIFAGNGFFLGKPPEWPDALLSENLGFSRRMHSAGTARVLYWVYLHIQTVCLPP